MRFFLFFILIAFASCYSSKKIAQTAEVDSFPETWAGTWKGDLDIFSFGKKTQTIPMTLTILPQGDSIQWTIQYDTMDTRPYSMKVVDASKGIYLVDEHNTIKIETYLYCNKLISHYEVAGNKLVITEEKIGETIIFEVIMAKDEPKSSGNQQVDGEEIPEVLTYPVKIYQRAELTKN